MIAMLLIVPNDSEFHWERLNSIALMKKKRQKDDTNPNPSPNPNSNL